MKLKIQSTINVKNKRASFDYEFVDKYTAGIALLGTEIKSIRMGKVSLVDSYCYFHNNELYLKNMNITEYDNGTHYNHEARRERKLLLNKKEILRWVRKTKETGLTIIPTRLFINDKGLVKVDVALAKGKKSHDKRESLKQKDSKREMDRMKKF